MNTRELWRTEYPFASHYREVMPGVRQHYVDEGAGKRTLLAVHGNPTWSFYYRSIVSQFASEYRVVAVDHVGCGLSDKPQDYPYHLTQHRDNLIALIEKLDLKRITLIAHDWGGPIGLTSLLKQRDRFERIILLNTGAFPPPFVPLRIAACRIPLLGTIGMRGLNLFSRAAISMAVSRGPLSPVARSGLLAPYDSWAHRVAVDRFVKDIPRGPHEPTWKLLAELESQLPSVAHLPSLLVWGMQDWCFRPECLYRIQKLLPQSETVEIADANHYVLEDAQEQVLQAMRKFFERTQA